MIKIRRDFTICHAPFAKSNGTSATVCYSLQCIRKRRNKNTSSIAVITAEAVEYNNSHIMTVNRDNVILYVVSEQIVQALKHSAWLLVLHHPLRNVDHNNYNGFGHRFFICEDDHHHLFVSNHLTTRHTSLG